MKRLEAPPVPAQFYLSSELHPAPALNTLAYAVRILGSLDCDRFERAMRTVVKRHAALRSRFEMEASSVFVWVDEEPGRGIEIREASASDAALLEAVEQVRGSLLPESVPWRAVLLRHEASDHTFLFAAHRSVWDEESARILASELSELYLNDGDESAAELASASDGLELELERPTEEAIREGASHFAEALAGMPPLLEFPLKASRPRVFPSDAADVVQAFSEETPAKAKALAANTTQSPFEVTAAAAVYALSRYCHQPSLVVGMPLSLRSGGRAIGSFTAMLPIAVDVSEAPDFVSFAKAFSSRVRRAQQYAATPFQAILKACGTRSEPSANVLFQFACVEGAELDLDLDLDTCACSPRRLPAPPQQVDLFLTVGREQMQLAYASELIDGAVAAGFASAISVLLQTGLEEPERPLPSLPLLEARELQRLAFDLNRTERPEFLESDLYQLISRHFGSDNARAALICGGRVVSYAELERTVEQIARRLVAANPSRGRLIGLCLPRSTDMVAALLAVLRTGNAYVPLDPAFPRDRLNYMVEHSGLEQVVTTATLRASFDKSLSFVELDQPAPPELPVAPAQVAEPDATAYVIYTSGSTGRPKGVAIPRQAAANFLASMLVRPGIGENDVLCAVTTLSFDIAVLELLAPLVAGGTVVVATEEEARDPRLLKDLLQNHRVTLLQATPVTWQMLCAAEWSGNPRLKALCGGEALSPALAALLIPKVGELWNMYGPTETTVWSTCARIELPSEITVGTAIHNTTAYVCDEAFELCPVGVEGRLWLGGSGVALGYLHDAELTEKRFLPDSIRGSGRVYDTGDRARRNPDGTLSVVGRSDFQVKVRGFRIELGEIETQLATYPGIDQVVCLVERDDPANPELVAFYTLKTGASAPSIADLRSHCSVTLPSHMVPVRFGRLDELPRTPNGKIDRKAFPKLGGAGSTSTPPPANSVTMPRGSLEQVLVEIWASVLSINVNSVHENFFEMGGTSIAAFLVAQEMTRRLHVEVSVLRIFEHPTVAALAKFLRGTESETKGLRRAYEHGLARRNSAATKTAYDVAIVGMAGRFPGAKNLDELWANLSQGRETVTTFKREELDQAVPAADRNDPNYIPVRGVLEQSDHFDASFFGFSPNEAELMDPQLRVFLECAWEAFENAGYVGEKIEGPVGVWAGMGNNFYYLYNVLTRPDKLAVMGDIAAEIANEKDHIGPRVSHKLNLTGPSLSVHTACSTTLVVIENAYQALISGQVDVALAGGVDVRTPQRSGQRYEDGGVFSIDGHCRPFDADATGTMFGEGVGAVVLKRLDDALRDNDTIHAVIKGAAINHDGGKKVSYLAPSVEGQANVIAAALGVGDVNPSTISYVEAHGTATPIGDPIEVEALTRVYRSFTQRRRYCAIGSIKGNFGHATTAAGIAGVLKVVLSMKHRKIPPTLHFRTPNPRIDFANSPFFVADKLLDWEPPGIPRRASVSSFGFCGTNAHVVLEEAPQPVPSSAPARPFELLLVSARNQAALEAGAERLAGSLEHSSREELADAAYTTHVGRKRFEHRRCAVVSGADEVRKVLSQSASGRAASLKSELDGPEIAFMFPGQGAQYINMGQRLYEGEPVFRDAVDRCTSRLAPHLGLDLRTFLFPAPDDEETAKKSLNLTFYTQPAIFTISYSMASLFMHWGIRPSLFIGHSIGEFVAATLSDVMSLDDALMLVATRGRLMQGLARGSMLSVRLPAETLVKRLPDAVDLAAVNSPQLCVVAGPTPAVEQFQAELAREGVACRMLHTSHAFHSSMMDEIVEPFQKFVEGIALSPPRTPFVSTVTGEWATAADVTAPSYWARHLRSPVLFAKAVKTLLGDGQRVLLECGPRRTCTSLALQQRPEQPARVIGSLPDSAEPNDEYPSLLLALGALWMNGCNVDWDKFHERERRTRIPLPGYAFQRQRYWIEPGTLTSFGLGDAVSALPGPRKAELPPAPAPAAAAGALSAGTVPLPATESSNGAGSPDELTQGLTALLEEALGTKLEAIDEDARFISLGLDSLLLTQFARMVRVRLGFNVSFRQLTEHYSTPRLLIEAIRGASTPKPTTRAPVARVPSTSPPPSSVREVLSSSPPAPLSRRASASDSGLNGRYSDARLGRAADGRLAWFMPDPGRPGSYVQVANDE